MVDVDDDLVIDEDNEVIEENDIEEEIVEQSEVSNEEEPETIQDDEDEEDRIVTIGDSDPDEAESEEESEDKPETPGWVKTVRKSNRKLLSENKRKDREIEELKGKINGTAENKPVELGEEPTLAGCKYDDVKYKQELRSYDERKRKVEAQASEKAETVEKQKVAWQGRQDLYTNKKQEHSFKDFGEVEELVKNTLSVTQQGIIVQCADDSALVVYALGKNPKKLEEFSKITAPLDFATKMGKLESQLKVSTKKAPKPETRINGGKTGASGSPDKVLARLMVAADKSGDYTDVAAHNKKIRNKDS